MALLIAGVGIICVYESTRKPITRGIIEEAGVAVHLSLVDIRPMKADLGRIPLLSKIKVRLRRHKSRIPSQYDYDEFSTRYVMRGNEGELLVRADGIDGEVVRVELMTTQDNKKLAERWAVVYEMISGRGRPSIILMSKEKGQASK